jgi:hypothetical protein
MKNTTRLLIVLNITLISIALLWVIGGNIYAQQQKRPIDQYWDNFFEKKIEIVKTNQSALKLEKLRSINFFNRLNDREAIKLYLEHQLENQLKTIDITPQKIHHILTDFEPKVTAIRHQILTSDPPQWGTEIYLNQTRATPLPSFLFFANLQQFLALDSLDKIRSGQIQEVLDNLELSWRIRESIRKQPTLIAQLVSLIIDSYLIGLFRKLDYVPPEWQDRINQLLNQDYYNSFSISNEMEVWTAYNSLSNLSIYFKLINKDDNQSQNSQNIFAQFIYLFHKPYGTFSAIDLFRKRHLFFQSIPNKNFCDFDSEKFKKQYEQPLASWNLMKGEESLLTNQWPKLFRRLINWELTLKIIQVKEIAAKQGKWPEKVPGLETSICEDRQWIYKVSPDGKTMSISYSKPPSWWQKPKIGTVDYPLSYSSQQIPRLKHKE